jgi:two-component system, NarL family, sensor histidine kinase UhpB
MRRRTLLVQVLLANLLLILGGTVAVVVATDPSRLTDDSRVAFVLGAALALTVAVNVWLLQRRFLPLERLVEDMERVDLSQPASNLPKSIDGRGETEEVERLELAFLRMLDRLEAERRRTSSAALQAQERERTRVARDLHDEVNQALTGILLHLEAAREKAPPELVGELNETKSLANTAMEELLSLARQLRPMALDDLGLKAALASHVAEIASHSDIRASLDVEGDFSGLDGDSQLVIYRVAQEALSNAVRHSGAETISVRLTRDGEHVELEVADDGRAFSFDEAQRGLGLTGMRERALLVGGDLQIESRADLGTRVRLRI